MGVNRVQQLRIPMIYIRSIPLATIKYLMTLPQAHDLSHVANYKYTHIRCCESVGKQCQNLSGTRHRAIGSSTLKYVFTLTVNLRLKILHRHCNSQFDCSKQFSLYCKKMAIMKGSMASAIFYQLHPQLQLHVNVHQRVRHTEGTHCHCLCKFWGLRDFEELVQ